MQLAMKDVTNLISMFMVVYFFHLLKLQSRNWWKSVCLKKKRKKKRIHVILYFLKIGITFNFLFSNKRLCKEMVFLFIRCKILFLLFIRQFNYPVLASIVYLNTLRNSFCLYCKTLILITKNIVNILYLCNFVCEIGKKKPFAFSREAAVTCMLFM